MIYENAEIEVILADEEISMELTFSEIGDGEDNNWDW